MPEAGTQTSAVFVNQVVFLTVNHRGPLPVREFYSTDETIVWRDPGGSWACLRPVYNCKWIHNARGWDTDKCRFRKSGRFSYGESPRTPPREGTSLHRRYNSVERPWGILSLFTTGLRLRVNWQCQTVSQTSDIVNQVVFLTVNHRGPLPLRELHSTDDTTVWRDPGGSWACLRPVHDYEWIHPTRDCDTYS